jgi:hypothetical protein
MLLTLELSQTMAQWRGWLNESVSSRLDELAATFGLEYFFVDHRHG